MKALASRFALFLLLMMPCLAHAADGPLGQIKFPKTELNVAAVKEDSFTLISDTVSYDETLHIITASGNVEIVQEPYVLMADTVTYNEKTSAVTASGNVSLMQPTGEVLFSNYTELSGDMKNGFMRHVRLLLKDNSRMAAVTGYRVNDIMTLHKVVYSPCHLCKEDPRKAPLWQMKASKVVHDKEDKRMKYYDARVEVRGIPVFYTPYLSHPDPSVKRKSGFLNSSYLTNDDLGIFVRNYYYWSLAPDYDATLEGSYSTTQGPLIGGEFRRRYSKGYINLSGSLTQGDFETRKGLQTNQFRGHYFAKSEFDFNNHWRGGYVGGYSLDPNYLRFYRISLDDIIRNRVYAERFEKRDYAAINAYAFQDLRPSRPGDQPNVLPQGTWSMLGNPGSFLGGRLETAADLLTIYRQGKAQDMQRLAGQLNWQRRFVSNTGLVAFADIKNEADFYSVQNTDPAFVPLKGHEDYTVSRFYPEAQLTARYPMARNFTHSTAMIEPIVAYTAIPRVKNSRIPNEDSQNFELDSTNLFALNRYPGIDRIDDSNRVTYGVKTAYDEHSGFYSSLFFGQSYNLNRLRKIERNSGLEDDFSDYIGEAQINPSPYLNANYRVRFDNDDFTPRQHELRFDAGPPILKVSGSYMMADQLASDSLNRNRRQQMNMSAVTRISKYWTFSVYDTRNIGEDGGGALASGAKLQYLDECFGFQLMGQRDFTQRIGVESGDTIYFQFSFRNIGDFSSPTLTPELLSNRKLLTSTQ